MRRLEIQIRPRHGTERRIVLNRFASLVATIVLAVLAIAVLVLALVFGYLIVGLALAGLLIVFIAAILRGAWSSIQG
jgi:small-conductance mechanosensitive channel